MYFGLYFWQLTQAQLAMLATTSVIGGFAGVALAPIVGRTMGKKWGVIAVFGSAVLVHVTPVSLRLLGLAPENGTPELLALLYGEEIINATLAAATGVLLFAILADVVEDAEVKTGRRSEGLLMSAQNLFRKAISGLGIFIATGVLTFIDFPEKAERTSVAPEVLRSLGLAYIPTILALYGTAILCLLAYNIGRKRHEENLAKLDALRRAEALPVDDAAPPAAEPGAPLPLKP
ncbi:MFS transporter [Phenylobacterium sp. J367]|uniref:MFS transporter n=1 Tax=Phenylobacterium sp. J367 TaxID=2898435 RepID=UPI002151B2A0|nr:MFS transporter [Phenylobacterium sp. J367]